MEPTSPAHPKYWMDRAGAVLPKSPKVILDLGGGSGQYKEHLVRPDDIYIILEVDYESYAVQRNLHRHQYVIGDGCSRIFLDGVFDVITMFEVLEHVRNPFQIYANCARWLRPGGVLIVSAPQYWHVHGWPSDYFRYTLNGLRELSRSAGLRMVDSWAMGGSCVLIWSVVELTFSRMLRFPFVRQIVGYPMLLLARLCDRLFFNSTQGEAVSDTKGWMMVARKEGSGSEIEKEKPSAESRELQLDPRRGCE